MTKAGLEKVKAAKVNGSWEKRLASEQSFDMPMELADGLDKNTNAKDYFDSLSPSFRKQQYQLEWKTFCFRVRCKATPRN